MRFAALGRTHWLYDAIRLCCERGHDVALIGTCPAAPEYTVNEDDFARLAAELSCEFFSGTSINDASAIQLLERADAELAISVNWATLIGAEARNAFPRGIINAHAGDLPRYRGNACANWAILNGEDKVVLTLHEMVDELDAGPIYLQEALPLDEATYIGDVYSFLDRCIPQLFADLLDRLAAGTVHSSPQDTDPTAALRTHPRRPEDARIDWSLGADFLARLVRASSEPFAGSFTFFEDERVTVWRAHAEEPSIRQQGIPGQVVEIRRDDVAVLTGDGLLVLELVEHAPEGRVTPARLVRSTRARFSNGRSSDRT